MLKCIIWKKKYSNESSVFVSGKSMEMNLWLFPHRARWFPDFGDTESRRRIDCRRRISVERDEDHLNYNNWWRSRRWSFVVHALRWSWSSRGSWETLHWKQSRPFWLLLLNGFSRWNIVGGWDYFAVYSLDEKEKGLGWSLGYVYVFIPSTERLPILVLLKISSNE